MKTPDDLQVDLVLAEPHIGQPLSMKWDSRGRLWVVKYLQYPNPAGLKMVSRDKFLRTRLRQGAAAAAEPFSRARTRSRSTKTPTATANTTSTRRFVEGLNLATSFEFGRGGVWVLNPPYLLFYPDANGDDVPDGDPVVHLEGFGIEDSHCVANNLRWGPDGWLYAAQGSTVTGDVKRPGDKTAVHSMGQLIWRYHPELKKYEIFAEGGGNAFGVEIDAKGRIYQRPQRRQHPRLSLRAGRLLCKRASASTAPLSNPYAFGYFAAMAHHNVPRFTHTFVIYDGGALPEQYHGQLFGVAPLLSHVVMSEVQPDRSSFKTKDVGYALESTDPWFRPVDIQVGPDGGDLRRRHVRAADRPRQPLPGARFTRRAGGFIALRAKGRRSRQRRSST